MLKEEKESVVAQSEYVACCVVLCCVVLCCDDTSLKAVTLVST